MDAPFTIDGTTYTPEDKSGYDAVGYASVWLDGGDAISAAHKTLPIPSYVEVTDLDSGKTALVRIERRGPMRNDKLLELSPGAAMQLGVLGDGRTRIRVRRVNPPDPERLALRSGQRAPLRMDSPKDLLAALMRKLDGQAAVAPPGPAPAAPANPVVAEIEKPTAQAAPAVPVVNTPPRAAPTETPSENLIVQVASFAQRANADRAAARLGGMVEPSGRFFRVRLGRFGNRGEASAALAKARAAGYSDARIQRAD